VGAVGATGEGAGLHHGAVDAEGPVDGEPVGRPPDLRGMGTDRCRAKGGGGRSPAWCGKEQGSIRRGGYPYSSPGEGRGGDGTPVSEESQRKNCPPLLLPGFESLPFPPPSPPHQQWAWGGPAGHPQLLQEAVGATATGLRCIPLLSDEGSLSNIFFGQ